MKNVTVRKCARPSRGLSKRESCRLQGIFYSEYNLQKVEEAIFIYRRVIIIYQYRYRCLSEEKK